MDLPAIFTTAFIVGFSGAMAPGPLLTVSIRESFRLGFVAGPLLMVGHGILELALVFALVGGLSFFLTQPVVAHIIAVVGGASLVYMGYGIVNDVYKKKLKFNIQQREINSASDGSMVTGMISESKSAESEPSLGRRRLHAVLLGMLVSISNPYWTIWWATVGLAYISTSMNSGYTGLAVFFTGHILSDFTWYSLVAAAAAGGRKILSDGVYKGVLTACAVFMIGLGSYFLYNGLFV
ncbi:LysE family translocator [Pelotomaculum terephthalicicum JT]|uniref:LysE family transporter n=1 Tax=Pelotomaculum terephthalicicum TaxID=206393 RepID=UPI001F04A2FA|nr:LysE family transporter [Pelotomaculum terephthalicicum]MCG9968616.1 LysE family translocator [Pelotomaculum terephthalicicum JT]